MTETLLLAHQSDRRKKPRLREYRNLTEAEVRGLGRGEHVQIILTTGRVGMARVNGAVRTWKRDPNRVEIPMKYGFRDCFTLTLKEATRLMVVEIEPTNDDTGE